MSPLGSSPVPGPAASRAPACTSHAFGMLVGGSDAIRNPFVEHTQAGQLPTNQEGFPATQTARQTGHYFERLCRTQSHQRPMCVRALSLRTRFGRVLFARVTGAPSRGSSTACGLVGSHSTEFSGGILRYSQHVCHFNTLPPPCLIHTHHCRPGDETWHKPPK